MTTAHTIQALIHAPNFRTYASADPIGVQVGGAIKNVLAVATGSATVSPSATMPAPPSSPAGSPR
jgi:glycerol-3-phosphate dehydrogenase